MLEPKVYKSIKLIDKDKWNSCFFNAIESYDYLLSLEESKIKGFEHLYYVIENNNKLLVACPAFITFYNFNTMADGFLKKIIPNFLGIKLLCLNSCFSENCLLGFAPGLSLYEKQELFSILIKFFKEDAKKRNIRFIGIRDLIQKDYEKFIDILKEENFTIHTSLPSAILPIEWKNINEYLEKKCSKVTRKEIKRKIKSFNDIVIKEYQGSIDEFLDVLITLYKDTEERSEWHFGELNKEYFSLLLKNCNNCFYNLYFVDHKLLAANLLLKNQDTLLDKFFYMSYKDGKKYNLYTLSWYYNIEYCIKHNIKYYQAGQTGYFTKKRLGCIFTNNYLAFSHSNKFINWVLRVLASKLISFNLEKDLQESYKKFNCKKKLYKTS